MDQVDKDRIVAEIRKRGAEEFGQLPYNNQCLVWARLAQDVLKEHGISSLIQAGNAIWTVGSLTHSYSIEQEEIAFCMELLRNCQVFKIPSRYHAWLAIKPKTVVDVSVEYFNMQGLPNYIWGEKEDYPFKMGYRADLITTVLAEAMVQIQRQKGIKPCVGSQVVRVDLATLEF